MQEKLGLILESCTSRMYLAHHELQSIFIICCYMQEKLGLILEKEDEMECLVGGCNFLLKAIRHEAFTYENGALNFVTNTGKCLSHDGLVLLLPIAAHLHALQIGMRCRLSLSLGCSCGDDYHCYCYYC